MPFFGGKPRQGESDILELEPASVTASVGEETGTEGAVSCSRSLTYTQASCLPGPPQGPFLSPFLPHPQIPQPW